MRKENFIHAIARDGRSYKPVNFQKAAEILTKWHLKSADDMKKWEKLQKKVKEAKAADEQAEEDLGEVPDEFLGMFDHNKKIHLSTTTNKFFFFFFF